MVLVTLLITPLNYFLETGNEMKKEKSLNFKHPFFFSRKWTYENEEFQDQVICILSEGSKAVNNRHKMTLKLLVLM